MDFRQLEAFAATVDCQSFSAAAEAIYLSQSTISSHISALEKELHVQLIRRTTKKFEVTKEGRRLYEYATAMLRLQHKAVSELSNASKNELHIGVSSVPGQCILPKVLAEYHLIVPEVQFHMAYSESLDIIQKVEEGSLDVGIVGMKIESQCVFEPLAVDELVVASPNTEYFRKRYANKPALKELLREPIIMRTERSGTTYEAEKLLRKLGIRNKELHIVACMNDAEAQRSCVLEGLGVSIVSYRMIREQERRGELLVFRLDECAWTREFYLVFQDSRYLPRAAEAFIDFLRKLSREGKL